MQLLPNLLYEDTHNLLLQSKHIVIEELVQLFIREIDAQLLEWVDLIQEESKSIKLAKSGSSSSTKNGH